MRHAANAPREASTRPRGTVRHVADQEPARVETPRVRILTLCTANRCRSPMASALLRRHLTALGVDTEVSSAGTSPAVCAPGESMVIESEAALAKLGIDPPPHRSRLITAQLVVDSDLVLAMAREHLREAVALAPEAWPRAFTLKELVQRGRTYGARRPDETVGAWLTFLGVGRVPRLVLADSPDDDVADPTGGPISAHVRTAREIDELAAEAAGLIAGVSGWSRDDA